MMALLLLLCRHFICDNIQTFVNLSDVREISNIKAGYVTIEQCVDLVRNGVVFVIIASMLSISSVLKLFELLKFPSVAPPLSCTGCLSRGKILT